MSQRKLIVAAFFAAPLAAAWPADAQDAAAKQYVDVAIAEPPKKGGLELTIKNGATISLTDSRDVIGVQPNGSTYTFGLKFDGTAIYRRGESEWRNILGINETLSRTPALPEIVKSADALAFETTYLYFVKPWFGPFARFTAATPLFSGYDVRAADTTYDLRRRWRRDPTPNPVRHFDLTDPFRPLTMKETVGPFVRPVTGEKWNVEARVGVGGLQTLAAGQHIITDDERRRKVEVTTLSNVFQVGGEGSLETWGAIYAKKISLQSGRRRARPVLEQRKGREPDEAHEHRRGRRDFDQGRGMGDARLRAQGRPPAAARRHLADPQWLHADARARLRQQTEEARGRAGREMNRAGERAAAGGAQPRAVAGVAAFAGSGD